MNRLLLPAFSPIALLALLLTAFALPARAQLFSIISNTKVNTSTNTITISGSGFSTKVKPTVYLGGTNLTVSSYTATSIVAGLGLVTAPGTYLLTVDAGLTFAAADVTLGAAGPTGATGLQGPMGLQGLQGPMGQPGQNGQPGQMGAQGPMGDTGAAGTPGPNVPPTLYGAVFAGGVIVGNGPSGTDIADLTLAPGNYLVNAVVTSSVAEQDILSCSLYDDINLAGTGTAFASGLLDLTSATNLPLLAAITIPATVTTDTVHLFCGTAQGVLKGVTATYIAMPVTVGSYQPFMNTVGTGGGLMPVITTGWNRVKND